MSTRWEKRRREEEIRSAEKVKQSVMLVGQMLFGKRANLGKGVTVFTCKKKIEMAGMLLPKRVVGQGDEWRIGGRR
jgi:hypothetical protein